MFFRELGSWVEDGSNTAPDKEMDKGEICSTDSDSRVLPMSRVASLCIADRSKFLQDTKAMQESRIEMLATKLIELIDAADYPTLLFTHETRMRHGLEELRSKNLVVEASFD